jgi:hypothetical protein
MASDNPTVERLEDQIAWYGQKSIENQRWFKRLKVAQIVAAAFIPFAAGISAPVYLTGGLGVFIVILEGLQSLNQYQHNWITYRSTCEELKHEKYLWLAKAGPYLNVDNPDALFAERIESLISREHAKWVSERKKAERNLKKTRS